MDDKERTLDFLSSQRLLVLATRGEKLHVTNVFYGVDSEKLYFVSGDDTRHSKHLRDNPEVAFSVAWYANGDHTDRKGVQGHGVCIRATRDEDIETGVQLHNELFPEFADRITADYIRSDENQSSVYIIVPSTIKYWDDEAYGNNGTRTVEF